MTQIVILDPSDQALITLDWTDSLVTGVTLSSVTHTVPLPLVKMSEATDSPTNRSQVKVRDARHAGLYLIEGQATLSNGEIINRQFPVRGFNS